MRSPPQSADSEGEESAHPDDSGRYRNGPLALPAHGRAAPLPAGLGFCPSPTAPGDAGNAVENSGSRRPVPLRPRFRRLLDRRWMASACFRPSGGANGEPYGEGDDALGLRPPASSAPGHDVWASVMSSRAGRNQGGRPPGLMCSNSSDSSGTVIGPPRSSAARTTT